MIVVFSIDEELRWRDINCWKQIGSRCRSNCVKLEGLNLCIGASVRSVLLIIPSTTHHSSIINPHCLLHFIRGKASESFWTFLHSSNQTSIKLVPSTLKFEH